MRLPRGETAGREGVGHRERMRDHAVMIQKLLQENTRISLAHIASEIGVSEITARRWVDSFSCVMPIRLEKGIVIIERKGVTRGR